MFFRETRTSTDPECVNLIALLTRCPSNSRRCDASPISVSGSPASSVSRNWSFLRSALGRCWARADSSISFTLNSVSSTLICPASKAAYSRLEFRSSASDSAAQTSGVEVIALILVEIGFQQQVEHAHDPAQGRADLVVQAGQECAFDLIDRRPVRLRNRGIRGSFPDSRSRRVALRVQPCRMYNIGSSPGAV